MTRFGLATFAMLLILQPFAWLDARALDSGNGDNDSGTKQDGTDVPIANLEAKETGLLIVPVPSLVSLLIRLESEKGTPLTEAEVLAARDDAPSIAMPLHAQQAVEKGRGYVDLDPENVWAEWLEYKAGQARPE